MKLIKQWGIGDIVQIENPLPIDGQSSYEHIEALSGYDIDNHISIRRSVRNIIENEENLEEFFYSIIHSIASSSNSRVVLSDTFSHSFNMTERDVIYVDDKSGRKAYLRVKPGIAMIDQSAAIVKPQTSIAEREIDKILNLDTWHPITEETNIEYSYEHDKYHGRIKKKDENGTLQTYNFLNGASSFGTFDASQASTTITADSGASFSVTAIAGEAFDGTAGNDVTVDFTDSGSGNLTVSLSGDTITIDFGGLESISASAIASEIDLLTEFSSSQVTSGDFTVADDIGVTGSLSGAEDNAGYNSGLELLERIAEETSLNIGTAFIAGITSLSAITLEPVLELPTDPSVDVWVGFDQDGYLELTTHPTEPHLPLWRVQVDTDTEQLPTLTDEREFYNITEFDYYWNDGTDYSPTTGPDDQPAVVFEDGKIWTCIQNNGPGTSIGVVRPSGALNEDRQYWLETGGGAGTSIVEYEPYDEAYTEGDFKVGMPGAIKGGKIVPASKNDPEAVNVVGLFVEDRSGTLLFQKIALLEEIDTSIIDTEPYSARTTITAASDAEFEVRATVGEAYEGVAGNDVSVAFTDSGVISASLTLTSDVSSGAGTIIVSADSGGAYDGSTGNDVSVAFIDSGSGGATAEITSNVITVDFGGDATITAANLATLIDTNISDISASEDTSGDFTLDDDNGRQEYLTGGSSGIDVSLTSDVITIDFGGDASLTASDIVNEINNLTDFEATALTSGNFTVADDIGLTADLEGGFDTGNFVTDQPVFVGNNGNLIQDTDAIEKEEYRIFLGYASSERTIDIQLNEPMLITDNPQYWDSVPLGGLIFNSSSTIRDGYVQADGRELSRTSYSELNDIYAADGYPHGDGDGSTTFNIPLYEDDAVIIKVRNVSVLTQEETVSVDERLTGLENTESSLGTAAFVGTDDFITKESNNVRVTVGPNADYATINEALEYLTAFETQYKKAGVNVNIVLVDGYVMREQVLVNDKDLGWITILSEVGGDPVEIESIEQGSEIDGYELPEISTVEINDYDVGIIEDAGTQLNGTYFELQAASGDDYYFWYNVNAKARVSFNNVYVRYDTAGTGGNGFNIVVDNDTSSDRSLSATLSGSTITVELAVSGGELDETANTRALVAAEIDTISGFSATSTGTSSISGSYDVQFSGGGEATNPNISGSTGIEIALLEDDTTSDVATKTETAVNGISGTPFSASATNELITIENSTYGSVDDITKSGNISVSVQQQGRDLGYEVLINASSHGYSEGDKIIIREHRSAIEEFNYDGTWTVGTVVDSDSFELSYSDDSDALYDATRAGIEDTGEIVTPEPVVVERSALTQMWEFFYYPAFGVARGTLPTIGCLFEMDESSNSVAGYESYLDGFCATDRGHINFLPGVGAGFKHADGSNIYGTRNSIINANTTIADEAGRHGYWAYANSIINARGSSALDCGRNAVLYEDLSDSSRDDGFDLLGRPIGNAVFATRGSLINADGITASSYGDAIIATYGSTINLGEHGGSSYSASSTEGSETKEISAFIHGVEENTSSYTGDFKFNGQIFVNKVNLNLAASLTWNSGNDTYSNHYVNTDRVFSGLKRCILNTDGTVNYYLNPNDSTYKASGGSANLDGTDGMVMVEIPKFYVRTNFSGSDLDRKYTWEVSDLPLPGFTVHPAFIRNGSEVNYRYIGAYDGCLWDDSASSFVSGLNYDDNTSRIDTSNDYLASVSGVYPMVGLTRSENRILANNLSPIWSIQDFYISSAIQLLALLEYGTFNLQSAISEGNTRHSSWPVSSGNQSDSLANIAGLSNSLGNFSGGVSTSGGSSNDFMSYRGIENFFGNVWNWVDGFNINDLQAYVSNNIADFDDNTSTNYDSLGSAMPSSSDYIRDIQNLEFAFLPSSVSGGSSSTFLTDYFYQNSGWRVALLGGDANDGLRAGAWYWAVDYVASYSHRNIGSRPSV